MLLLDTRPLFKGLTSAEDVTPTPAAWLSSGEFVYAAGGVLWKTATGERPARGRAILTRRALSNLLASSPACFARACANRPWRPDFGESSAPQSDLPTQSSSTCTNE